MQAAASFYSSLAIVVLSLHALFILWLVFGALPTRSRPVLRWAESGRDQEPGPRGDGEDTRGVGEKSHRVHMGRIRHPDYSGGSGLGLREDAPRLVADAQKRLCARQHGPTQLGAAVISDCHR